MKYFRRKSEVCPAARGRMLNLMDKLAETGKRQLPNLREICAELGVSIMTANKIMRRLVAEGRIIAVPRKGYFITEKSQWDVHIAVVAGMIDDMTYVSSSAVLAGLLETAARLGFQTRIVQVSSPEKAAPVLREEGVAACAWYFPSESALAPIEKISKTLEMPSLAVTSDSWGEKGLEKIKMPHVSLDHQAVGIMRAEFFLRRGHTAVAALNEDREGVSFNALEQRLKESGCHIKSEWRIKRDELESRLPELLDRNEVTAAYILGRPAVQERTFKALEAHPRGRELMLLPDAYPGEEMQASLKKHEGLKISGVNLLPDREIGAAATKILADCLLTGQLAGSQELPGRIIDVGDFCSMCGWR